MMRRLRTTFIAATAFVAIAALTHYSLAQQQPAPGGPPPGGGGFGGFGGGRGGPGGFFGRGNNLLMLATNPAVQTELKADEEQKAAIKSLSDKVNEKNRELFAQMGAMFGRGPNGNGNGQGGGQNRGQGQQANNGGFGGGGNGGFGGGGGGQNNGGGGGGGGRRGRNANGGQGQGGGGFGGFGGGGFGGQGQMDPEQAARVQEIRDAMTKLRQDGEKALANILDKSQMTRLRQVALQLDYPDAIFREDMIEKLAINEDQLASLQELRNENRQLQGELRKADRQRRDEAFSQLTPLPANPADPGNNGNGAGNRGPNQKNRPRYDPEQVKKLMESPEMQAQMEENRAQQKKLDDQYAAAINKLLYPRQRTALKKMLGAPFDRSKIFAGFGPGGRNNQAARKNAGAKDAAAKPKSDDDDEESTASSTASKPAAPPKAKTTSKRKSLRDLRGGDDD
jgi:hypothetical protein